jgi:hypothetical protein
LEEVLELEEVPEKEKDEKTAKHLLVILIFRNRRGSILATN